MSTYWVKKAQGGFYACKMTFGRTWDLNPRMLSWIYTAVCRPILLYVVSVWCSRAEDVIMDVHSGVYTNSDLHSICMVVGTKKDRKLSIVQITSCVGASGALL